MSDLTLMIVNGDRYLLNTASKAVDRVAEDILKQYPSDACVDFTNPLIDDLL
jgi:hypothetical protein